MIIDIDIFDVDGQYYISEVNPRFGGGYPHAYESGCNHMKLILNNLSGKTISDLSTHIPGMYYATFIDKLYTIIKDWKNNIKLYSFNYQQYIIYSKYILF